MCRNIKTLANFAPPATDEEIRASAVQFVRKLSGTTHPSHANESAFNAAVDDVSAIARRLVDSITTKPTAQPGRGGSQGARTRRETIWLTRLSRSELDCGELMPWLGFEPRRLAALPLKTGVYQFHHQAGEET